MVSCCGNLYRNVVLDKSSSAVGSHSPLLAGRETTNKYIFFKHFFDLMRAIYTFFIILLVLMTSAQCQQTAADWFNKGDALTSQGKYDDAIQAYDQAIQLKPNYDNAWYNKGVALKALGRTNESDAAFAKAKELANLFLAPGVSASSPSVSHSIIVSAAQKSSQNTQYNTMPTVSAPSTHVSAPAQTLIIGKTPAIVYLSTQQNSVPYSQYQANTNNAVVPSLWIQETGSWTQYLEIPQGATVPLIVISSTGASGYLSEILNGSAYNSSFYFYPNSMLTFYADTIGQHILSVNINGQSSNQVTINVIAYVPPQCYPTPCNYYGPYNYLAPNYMQSYYYPGLHYPYYEFGRHWSRFWGGHNWYDSDNYPWLNAP